MQGQDALDIGAAPHPERSVSQLGVLAQSVAMTAPSGTIAAVAPLVAGVSGAYAWLTWLVGSLAILAVGYAISQLSQRYATTGGLYALATKAGGPGAGFVTSWMLVAFCLVAAISVAVIFGLIAAPVLHNITGVSDGTGTQVTCMFVALLLALALAYLGVKLSLTVMLVLEGVSCAFIVVLLIAALAHHNGSIFDSAQLHLGGVHINVILPAVVFVIYSFAGFESSSVLGLEARNPERAITVAILGSAIFAGGFFVISSYIMTLSLGPAGVAASANALTDLAVKSGMSWMVNIIGLGIAASIFSATLALITELGHLIFTLSRERLLHPRFALLSPRTGTPSAALAAVAVVALASLIALAAGHAANVTWYGYISTFSGYTIMLAYLVVSVAAGVFLARRGQLRIRHVAGSGIAAVALLYVLYKSAFPIPAWPSDLILYLFCGTVVAVVVGYLCIRAWRRDLLDRVGSSVDADTASSRPPDQPAPKAGAGPTVGQPQ